MAAGTGENAKVSDSLGGKKRRNNSRVSKTPEEEKQELSDNPLIRVVLYDEWISGNHT